MSQRYRATMNNFELAFIFAKNIPFDDRQRVYAKHWFITVYNDLLRRWVVSHWKSLESVICHVLLKMSRTALNIRFYLSAFQRRIWVCCKNFPPRFYSLRGRCGKYLKWKRKIHSIAVFFNKKTIETETRESFSIQVCITWAAIKSISVCRALDIWKITYKINN